MKLQHILAGLLLAGAATPALAQQGELPIKYSGPATVPAITAGDLMTRLYQYADDSMMGRRVGTPYNDMATAYIERELRRLGLTPGGDDGGYFQNIGVVARGLDTAATTLTIEGTSFKAGVDFLAATQGSGRKVSSDGAIVWGSIFDTIGNPTPEQYRGKFVVMVQKPTPPGFNPNVFVATDGYRRFLAMSGSADIAGLVSVNNTMELNPNAVRNAITPLGFGMYSRDERPVNLTVTPRVAEAIFGSAAAAATAGSVGKGLVVDARFNDSPRPGRNVIAKVQGTDPKLRGQYVVIGAHNDHVGLRRTAVDHDSLKLFNIHFAEQGADSRNTLEAMKDETKWATLRASLDSIRRIRAPRLDSIINGADDDGSGSMAMLEIAEALAKGSVKPKRSLLLVWHTGEESGMWGSGYFARNPTVARDSIVAQINVDMIGRGGPDDITGQQKDGALVKGDVKYVQLVGSRRLSRELGDLMEAVNSGNRDYGFRFDYSLDANGHPQNIYCRSDHASYAAFGIPVVFFTTGGHADYHQATDEPQYIRYDHLANLTRFILDASLRVANLDHRVKVDQPGPFNPDAPCQQ